MAAPWAISATLAAALWAVLRSTPTRSAAPVEPPPGLSRRTVAEPEVFEAQEPGRGRLAGSAFDIPVLGWRDILWRTGQEIGQDRLPMVAGSVTYYTLLAIFPAVGAFVSLYGLFADVTAVREQLIALSAVIPPEAVRLIGEQMMRLANGETAGLSVAFVVSLLLSLWSANAGMKALFDGLNIAYDEAEKRSFVARTALTYGFTAALILFLSVISGLLVAAPMGLERAGLGGAGMMAVRWPVVFLVAAAAFAVLYRFGPSRALARWRWVAPGALFAAVLWMGGSAGFSWYLNNVAGLDATYGSLGAVVGFMLWVWLSVMVVLTGAELNSEIEHQTARDSTTGPPQPMGERGAVMADTVGVRFRGVRAYWGDARRALDGFRRR